MNFSLQACKNSITYFIRFVFFSVSYRNNIKIINENETIEYIIRNKVSVSRFGDGELRMIKQAEGNSFQKYDAGLATRLLDILKSNQPGHVVCLPYAIKSVSHMTEEAGRFWMKFLDEYQLRSLQQIICKDKVYYDASITRFYLDYKNKRGALQRIAHLKMIWEQQDIYIVEGEHTKLGIGNDLFANAKSIRRIVCPAENAYSDYLFILQSVFDCVPAGSLVLLALGMTATVLAYDLYQSGYQALDIGHVDIEYEWLLRKTENKIPVQGKYVCELGGVFSEMHDCEYESQVLRRLV